MRLRSIIVFISFFLLVHSFVICQQAFVSRPTVSKQLIHEFNFSSKLNEISGVINWRNKLWAINDKGNKAKIYGIDPVSQKIDQVISIDNAENIDWEDITQDDNCIYIGDFGDNKGKRDDLCILKIFKKEIPFAGNIKVSAKKILFSYTDRPENIEGKHNFDCEAFISKGEYLYLFSKNRENYKTSCYQISKNEGLYNITAFSVFPINALVTGADYNPNTEELILVGYTKKYSVPFIAVFWDFVDDNFFHGKNYKVDFIYNKGRQLEGVCFKEKRNLYLSCEATDFYEPSLFSFDYISWINFDGINEDKLNKGLDGFKIIPNPGQKGWIKADFTNLPKGNYVFRVMDEFGNELIVREYRFKNKKDKFQIKINTTEFAPGVYYVNIYSEDKFATRKAIVY
ncbi:MAG: T9SS type A sorting domain-containing protein [Bacteroidales bacterium]